MRKRRSRPPPSAALCSCPRQLLPAPSRCVLGASPSSAAGSGRLSWQSSRPCGRAVAAPPPLPGPAPGAHWRPVQPPHPAAPLPQRAGPPRWRGLRARGPAAVWGHKSGTAGKRGIPPLRRRLGLRRCGGARIAKVTFWRTSRRQRARHRCHGDSLMPGDVTAPTIPRRTRRDYATRSALASPQMPPSWSAKAYRSVVAWSVCPRDFCTAESPSRSLKSTA